MSLTLRKSKIFSNKKVPPWEWRKKQEFVATGGEIYEGNLPDGANHDH